jgi:hypothetical protein
MFNEVSFIVETLEAYPATMRLRHLVHACNANTLPALFARRNYRVG